MYIRKLIIVFKNKKKDGKKKDIKKIPGNGIKKIKRQWKKID